MLVQLSVRQIIEFVMRSGDIDTSFFSNARAVEGIKAHQRIQKSYGHDYIPEVTLKNVTQLEEMTFMVEGRADGLLSIDGMPAIDEIKSTTRALDSLREDSHPLHWAQAICYAWFFAEKNGADAMKVQLTYVHVETDETVKFVRAYTAEELQTFYMEVLQRYLDFSRKLAAWRGERRDSAASLTFPWPTYRKGQREMAEAVYASLSTKKNLFVDAPTGIGKTMSALFPTVKLMADDLFDTAFYVTARNTQKQAAVDAVTRLQDHGVVMRTAVLNAKDRACLNDKVACNPIDCPFAKGHYDRVNDCLVEAMDADTLFDADTIAYYAQMHTVCPFELSLDIATYADLVVGDYNYVFDPRVYLKRFFDDTGTRIVVLVDEAHNLIDRGRSMYSAEISTADVEPLIPLLADQPKVYKAMEALVRKLVGLAEEKGNKEAVSWEEETEDLYYPIKRLTAVMDPFLGQHKDHPVYDEALDLYFKLNAFVRISQFYGKGFSTVLTSQKGILTYKLFCMDPSEPFKLVLQRIQSAVFFSATLTPMDFYRDVLGGGEGYKMHLDSPFPHEQLCLLQISINTRYRFRSKTLAEVVDTLHAFTHAREGNYLVFFPSYAYMDQALKLWTLRYGEGRILAQTQGMGEKDRRDFLAHFDQAGDVIGMVVMGGLFSEGIDLVGERLIGAAVVSVGMPGVSYEQNLIKNYFDEEKGAGFEYAYLYPGMNKVLQSAGRVIRTAEDIGAVLLIDDRFGTSAYQRIYPRHWMVMEGVRSRSQLVDRLEAFWKQKKENTDKIQIDEEENHES